jgi:hypothetical protein
MRPVQLPSSRCHPLARHFCFPISVHAVPLRHRNSFSAPPPPVTVVPNVVQAASPQFAASPSLIEASVPGTAGGRVAKVSAGSAEDGRLSVPIGSAACAVPKTGKCGPKDCDASPSNSSPSQAVRLGHFDAAAVAWFNHRATVCRRLFGVGGGIGTRRCHDESHQGLPREAAE